MTAQTTRRLSRIPWTSGRFKRFSMHASLTRTPSSSQTMSGSRSTTASNTILRGTLSEETQRIFSPFLSPVGHSAFRESAKRSSTREGSLNESANQWSRSIPATVSSLLLSGGAERSQSRGRSPSTRRFCVPSVSRGDRQGCTLPRARKRGIRRRQVARPGALCIPTGATGAASTGPGTDNRERSTGTRDRRASTEGSFFSLCLDTPVKRLRADSQPLSAGCIRTRRSMKKTSGLRAIGGSTGLARARVPSRQPGCGRRTDALAEGIPMMES